MPAADLTAPTRNQYRPATLGGDLRVALTRISRRLRAQRGEADLPEGRFGVLTVLHKHGAMSPSELAEHERVRPPSMTRAVNALVEMGLVEKGSTRATAVRSSCASRTPACARSRRRGAAGTRGSRSSCPPHP